MPDRREFDEQFRRVMQEAPTSPVRWERVASRMRRRDIAAAIGLALVGLMLTLVLSLGVLAGKSAIDPTFRPPLLSNASGKVEFANPRLGWGLFDNDLSGASGYLMRANLELNGMKGRHLVTAWRIKEVDEAGSPEASRSPVLSRIRKVTPSSNAERLAVEQLIPRPLHTGLYRIQVALKSPDGKVLDEDRSNPVYVVGKDCCERYKTPMYASLLPRGWHLDEDFAPNPGERFVTLARGPAENSLDIDTSLIDPKNKGGNPLEKARELRELLAQNGTGYRLLSWRRDQVRGSLTVEWSYRLEGDAFTDIFFYRGPSGFAVLGRSAPPHFRETRDLTRVIARSVDPRS